MKTFILFSFAVLCNVTLAQNEHTKWYFGNQAGLDFMNSPATPMINSAMSAIEGCANVSDGSGALLFYTDGWKVYNKNHLIMDNGSGLDGIPSATQSSLIIRKPGSDSLFYLFTVGLHLEYSLVDMSLAAGLGSVTVKNFTLLNMADIKVQSSEKLHGAKHCNGRDYWIVTHPMNVGTFHSFLVSAAGVNSVSVVSAVGEDTLGIRGTLKISPQGNKLALVDVRHKCVIVHDFDNSNGTVSSSSLVLNGLPNIYSAEFSPDGSKLYSCDGLTGNGGVTVYQWDLCAGNNTAIINSKTIVYSDNGISGGALQLAPDGKIYRARYAIDTVAVINFPNSAGLACNYKNAGLPLAGKKCSWGLPNYIWPEPKAIPVASFSANCQNVSFSVQTPSAGCTVVTPTVVSTLWNFGDPSSASNTSTITNAQHFYSSAGSYTAQLIINYPCTSDTIKTMVVVSGLSPTINITGDSTICAGEKTILLAGAQGNVTWNTNQTGSSLTVSPGSMFTYVATVTGTNGCTSSAKIKVLVEKCLGISKETSAEVRIYPSPAGDVLFIESQMSGYWISLRDPLGRLLSQEKQQNGPQNKIDVSELNPGIYYLDISEGDNTVRLRFIKQ